MAWLKFDRARGEIALYGGTAPGNWVAVPVGVWPAHNEATKSSKGSWPSGTWKWSHYNLHVEAGLMPACHATAYGCYGIHVFQVTGRPGIGVHAGRTKGEPMAVGGKTLGCIRVPVSAMQQINEIHQADKLLAIIVAG
jgi:hypothetical protein